MLVTSNVIVEFCKLKLQCHDQQNLPNVIPVDVLNSLSAIRKFLILPANINKTTHNLVGKHVQIFIAYFHVSIQH